MKGDATVRQVIVLLIDGARPDVLETLLRRGDLPSIRHLFPDEGGDRRVETLCSTFPSTTGPAHLPFLTGRYPGPCNVPGIRWFDPHRYSAARLSPFRFRSYLGPGALLAGRDLSADVKTLFEVVPDHACAGGNVRRGVRFSRNVTRWSKLGEPVVSFLTERWDRLDRRVGEALVRAVTAGRTVVFGALYAADSHGHKWGPLHDLTLAAYRQIDAALGDLVALVHRLPEHARPLVLLVSDHGQSPTTTHLDLHQLVERMVGRCLAHPTIWHGLFDAAAAVMVSGNAMAHIYLRGRRWGDLRYLDGSSPEAARLVEALLAEDAVDQVIARRPAGGGVVVSRHGRAEIDRSASGIAYRVGRSGDPFGYPESLEGTHDERQWLELTWNTDYPDAPVQVLQILQSPRAGDLIVTARPGYDLRARHEKPRHVGSHGSLHRDHMMTPIVSTHPLHGGPRRTVDVFPTTLHALGLRVPPGLDGRSLWPSGTAPRSS